MQNISNLLGYGLHKTYEGCAVISGTKIVATDPLSPVSEAPVCLGLARLKQFLDWDGTHYPAQRCHCLDVKVTSK